MTIRIFFCSLLFSMGVYSYGQQVFEMQSELNKSSDLLGRSNESDLSGLAFENKPTLFYNSGNLVPVSDTNPVRVVTDVSSLPLLTTADPKFAEVRMICIKINNPGELSSILDISGLAGFSKLKYIYFICSFKICGEGLDVAGCETEKISHMLRGMEGKNIKVLYTSQNEE